MYKYINRRISMPKITKLERQKHNAMRVSVFVDGEYAFSAADELIIEYGLKVGTDANSLPLEKLMKEDNYRTALSKAYRHLSVSEKTEKQMRDFLVSKEFDTETVERVIDKLRELKYIDDNAFADTFAEYAKNSGRRAIRYKLKMKGISDEIINGVLDGIDDEQQLEAAVALAAKQKQKYAKLPIREQKNKTGAFLARRGFDWDTVSAAIEKCFSEDEE